MGDTELTGSNSHLVNYLPEMAVAIIGMSGRFPGARNVTEFWQNLRDGVRSIRFFSDEELRQARVPEDVLEPSESWGDKEEYWRQYDALAARYIENFKLFAAECPPEVLAAGPKRYSETG